MEDNKPFRGWNGSRGSFQTAKKGASKNGASKSSLVRGTLALIVIVLLGGIAMLYLTRDRQIIDDDTEAKRSSIKEVKPNLPAKRPAAKVDDTSPTTKVTKTDAPEVPEVKSRKAPSTAKKYPRRVIPRRPEPPQKFKYDSDDLIGAFLEIAPGDQVEGGLRFDKIGRDFDKSLLEDVALAEGQEDIEYNKQLREMVRETKKEIQKVMREENKTFGQVMQEQFDQLIELGQYKRNLEAELREIRKSGEYTPEEYEKFIEASNAMLRGKGCAELKVPKATFYQVELYRQRRAAKEAMGLEKETKESKAAAIKAMHTGDNEE